VTRKHYVLPADEVVLVNGKALREVTHISGDRPIVQMATGELPRTIAKEARHVQILHYPDVLHCVRKGQLPHHSAFRADVLSQADLLSTVAAWPQIELDGKASRMVRHER
jgi:hypothetical protein